MSVQLPKGFFKQQGINLQVGIHSHLRTSVKLRKYMTSIKEYSLPLFIYQFLLHFQNGMLGKNQSLRNSETQSPPWNWEVPPSIKNQLQKFKFKRTGSKHLLNLYLAIIVSTLRAERSRQQCRRELSTKILGHNSSEYNNSFTSEVLCVLVKSLGLIKFCMMPKSTTNNI